MATNDKPAHTLGLYGNEIIAFICNNEGDLDNFFSFRRYLVLEHFVVNKMMCF